MKKIFLATVAAAVASLVTSFGVFSPAMAADLAPHAKAPAMMSPATNWSGFYAGVNVGYGWGHDNTDAASPFDTGIANTSVNNDPKGVIGGGQVGYNWQAGSFVAGVEADISGSGIKGTAAPVGLQFTDGSSIPGTFASSDQQLSWFGTVRGRLGATVTPDLLIYGTGGLAYGEVKGSANRFFAAVDQNPANFSATKTGWTAGAGAEWMFARGWSAKVEYLHIDLGGSDAAGVHITPPLTPAEQVQYAWRNAFDIVRIGVNYHFN
jgi:outer membrane immunogenic protein